MRVERACRICGSQQLETVLALGEIPLADALADDARTALVQRRYPLTVVFCATCSLVQTRETVSPEELFCGSYPYYSSFSEELLRHARAHAQWLTFVERLDASKWVVEIASNDGYLLQNFVAAGIPVLGIEPAPGPSAAARNRGVTTRQQFFSRELAEQLYHSGRRADVIIANNVLAHVADIHGVVEGIKRLLADDGVATIEFPYIRDLIDNCQFDTIYHEHLCYFSLHAAQTLFRHHGLIIHDVERISIHGGSLRLHVSHARPQSINVQRLLYEEQSVGLTLPDYYRSFACRVERMRADLRCLLMNLRIGKKRIAAYGAAAKGSTILNYAGIGADLVDFVVDRNIHKHGRYMPGIPILICDPARLIEDAPDYVLLLAWNFQEEILDQQQAYLQIGGKFIIPVPELKVLPTERSLLRQNIA